MKFFRKISWYGLLMILFGAMMTVQTFPDLLTSFKTPKDFDEVLDSGAAAGDRVEGQVPFLLDYFATEESWTENQDGSRTPKKTSNYYYVLPAGDDFIGLTVSPGNASDANKLVDQTYDFLDGGAEPDVTLEVTGRVCEMEADLVSMFEEELRDYYGYSDHDLSALKPYLLIENRSFTAVRVLCGGGVLLALAGVFVTVRRWKKYSIPETSL